MNRLPSRSGFIAPHEGCFRAESNTRYTGALSSNVWTSLSVGTPCTQHSTELDLTLLDLEQHLIISALESNCTNHNNEGMKEDIVWAS